MVEQGIPVERVVCAAGHIQFVKRPSLTAGLRYHCKGCCKQLWAEQHEWVNDLVATDHNANTEVANPPTHPKRKANT